MTTYKPAAKVGLSATAPIAAHQFVGLNGQPCGAGESAIGVAEYAAEISQSFSVIVAGTALVEAGAAITATDTKIECNADGKAVPHSAGKVCGFLVPGSTATTAGDLIEILVVQSA